MFVQLFLWFYGQEARLNFYNQYVTKRSSVKESTFSGLQNQKFNSILDGTCKFSPKSL